MREGGFIRSAGAVGVPVFVGYGTGADDLTFKAIGRPRRRDPFKRTGLAGSAHENGRACRQWRSPKDACSRRKGLIIGFPVRHSGVHLRPGKSNRRFHDPFRVKGLAGLEHEVDGVGQLIGEDGVALELAMLGDQPVGVGTEEAVGAFADDGGLPEGPAQIGITHLAAGQPLEFSGAGDGTFDQSAVAGEVLDGREAGNGVELIEDGHGQDIADSGHRLQEGVVAALVLPGVERDRAVEFFDQLVVNANGIHVAPDGKLVVGVGRLGQDAFLPDIPVMATFLGGNAVLGGLVHGQMRHQFSPVPHVTHALPQQGTDRAAFRRVNVGRRNQVAAQQVRQFLRVYAVILVLAAVNMSGIQGVGQPVPTRLQQCVALWAG